MTPSEEMYEKTGWGQPLAVPALVFTTFSFLCFAQCCGFGAQDATQALSFGIIQVILFIGFFVCGILLIKRGMSQAGQTYTIFAITFGGVGGVSNILTYCQAQGMLTYDGFMFGIVNMVIGWLLIFVIPTYIHGSLVDIACSLCPGIGLICFGITGMGLCPDAMMGSITFFAGIMFLLTGIAGMICMLNALMEESGIQIPCGPVLFPAKED